MRKLTKIIFSCVLHLYILRLQLAVIQHNFSSCKHCFPPRNEMFISSTWNRTIFSYRRVRAAVLSASKLPMFANTMIARGLWLMLPTARACLIYRGRTPGRVKSSAAPLGSEAIPTCRCNDAPLLPQRHAPLYPRPADLRPKKRSSFDR